MVIPNLLVSFELKLTNLVSFERYYNPKCNSLNKHSLMFYFRLKKTVKLAKFSIIYWVTFKAKQIKRRSNENLKKILG